MYERPCLKTNYDVPRCTQTEVEHDECSSNVNLHQCSSNVNLHKCSSKVNLPQCSLKVNLHQHSSKVNLLRRTPSLRHRRGLVDGRGPPSETRGEVFKRTFLVQSWGLVATRDVSDTLDLEGFYCDLKGSRALLRILSMEGRVVRLCWARSKLK